MYKQKRTATRPMTVIAHRGYSSMYPENTLLAFQKAIEIGADYIEFDVRRTKDDVLVVSHDASLERCGKTNARVDNSTLSELRAINLGSGQQIPTLEEVFRLCKGRIGMHLEIKGFGITPQIARMIREQCVESEVIASSFKHVELMRIKEEVSDLPCSIVVPAESYEGASPAVMEGTFLFKAMAFKATGIHVSQSCLSEELVKKAHDAGLYLNVWNVDSPIIWEACLEMGVDGVFTNDAGGLIQYLGQVE
ncbi:MAG: glycerophosphodiester phosphodiesterase [Candidatus Lokiarchaeota archaeon]|nr:glycerophosphodiester phosphodiesterase [Candidatus Lokiarchaeota archaeon]